MLDWTRVEELRNEVGGDDFEEIVAMFLEETDEAIGQLASCGSAHELERTLHSLKGSALNIGLAGFAGLCQSGEKQAAAGRCDLDLAHVRETYFQSRNALIGGLPAVCS